MLIEHGEYSDYSVMMLVRFTTDVDPMVLKDEFRATDKDGFVSSYEFGNWLVNVRRVAEEVPHGSWWVGAYGQLSFKEDDVSVPAEHAAALTAAAERERVLRGALQYYADGNGPLESDHTTDYGARARAALEATK